MYKQIDNVNWTEDKPIICVIENGVRKPIYKNDIRYLLAVLKK